MILSPTQSTRVIRLVDTLVAYANEILGIVDSARVQRNEEGNVDGAAASLVLQKLWDHPSIIDDFVRENPADLGKRDLRTVAQWGKGLVSDFYAVRLPDGRAMLYAGERLFDVCGITHEFDELFPELPCATRTMLMPFDGRITYLVIMERINLVMGPNIRSELEKASLRALQAGIVSTEDELFRETERIRQLDAQKKLDREAARKKHEEAEHTTAPGHHRGALAGLSEEEAARVRAGHGAELSEELFDFALDDPASMLDAASMRGKPKLKLAELLSTMKRDELSQMVVELGLPIPIQLKKADLVKFMAEEIVEARYLEESVRSMTPNWLDFLKRVVDAGGILIIPETDAAALQEASPPHPPVLFLYHSKVTFTYVVPQELVELLPAIDWARARKSAKMRESIMHLADAATELRGIVPMAEFFEDCRSAYPELTDDEEVAQLAMEACMMYPLFRILITDDDAFLLNIDLVHEYLRANPELAAMAMDQPAFIGPLDYPLDDILDSQADKEPRPLGIEVPSFALAVLWRMTLPSAQELRAWLNENVPDGADDYLYAEWVMQQFVAMTRWGSFEPDAIADYIDVLVDAGSELDLPHMQVFTDKLVAFINEQPLWMHNGWSAKEIADRNEKAGSPRVRGPILYDTMDV